MRNTTTFILEVIVAVALTVIAFTVVILLFPSMKGEVAAAWIQAIGSIVAIGVAIAIPAVQRKKDRIKARREELERDLVMWGSVYFLLNDVTVWLQYMQKMQTVMRSYIRQDRHVDDLLERIGFLERREQNHERLNALYISRIAIVLTHADLTQPWAQNHPLNENEIAALDRQVKNLSEKTSKILTSFTVAEQQKIAYFESVHFDEY